MPMCNDREYRALQPLQITQEKRIKSDFYVEGYATTFDKPYEMYEFDGVKYYEMIDSRALDGADMSDIIFQYDHRGKVLARKSNETLIVEPDSTGLFICADLGKSRESREMFEEIDSGLVTKMSWGFTVEADEYDKATRTRIIKRIKKVYDVSAVSIPANADTNISSRSYFAGVAEVEKQELLKREHQKRKLKLMMEVSYE